MLSFANNGFGDNLSSVKKINVLLLRRRLIIFQHSINGDRKLFLKINFVRKLRFETKGVNTFNIILIRSS